MVVLAVVVTTTAEDTAVRVRPSDGEPIARNKHLLDDEAWLVCERRMGGELEYHLANQDAATPLETIAADIEASIDARDRASPA